MAGPIYFSGFEESDAQPDVGQRTVDHGADALPFTQLGGRRFEALVYLILDAEKLDSQLVCLMQGVGEGGRDIVVFEDGRVVRIIQCKNQGHRIGRPDVVEELLKIALHAFLDGDVLADNGSKLAYEMWCTGDFSETAISLLGSWPANWTIEVIGGAFSALKKKYVKFKDIEWEDVNQWTLTDFPSRLSVRPINNVLVSSILRKHPKIHERFFEATIVMKKEDAGAFLLDTLGKAGIRLVSDEEVAHILDRIQSFPLDERIYLINTHIMGPNAQFYGYLTNDELKEFLQNAMGGLYHNIQIIFRVTARIVEKIAENIRSGVEAPGAFFYVVRQCLTVRSLEFLSDWLFMFDMSAISPVTFAQGMSDDELARHQIALVWPEMQGIVAKLESASLDPESDDALRLSLARLAISQLKNEQQAVDVLSIKYEENRDLVLAGIKQLRSLLPKQMLIVVDSVSFFKHEKLKDRIRQSIKELERFRKETSGDEAGA